MNAITTISARDDVREALRATAMLADVTISLWGAERTDHAIMDRAKRDANAVGNVGRAIKNLLAGADEELRATRAAFQAVRAQHYGLTLPWVSDPHAERQRGPRLLPNMLFDRYMGEVSNGRRRAMAALDSFIAAYPDCVVRARANLGGLADADYPDAATVRASFRIAFDFAPIPAGTDFAGLPEATLGKLATNLERRQAAMMESAARAMWDEVRERVGRLAARLADPEASFKTATVEAVQELAALLPGWNIAGDERAAEIARDISRMTGGLDAKRLRDNATLRADMAEQASAVTDKLRAWGL